MRVVSPVKYDLRGGLVIEKGETVIDIDRVSPLSKPYLDKLIADRSVTVLEDAKPAKAAKPEPAKAESKPAPTPEPKAETPPVEASTRRDTPRKSSDDK